MYALKNIKVLISMPVIYNLKVWNQDVSQEYIEALDLEIDVYVIPDSRFNISISRILKLLKPIYG